MSNKTVETEDYLKFDKIYQTSSHYLQSLILLNNMDMMRRSLIIQAIRRLHLHTQQTCSASKLSVQPNHSLSRPHQNIQSSTRHRLVRCFSNSVAKASPQKKMTVEEPDPEETEDKEKKEIATTTKTDNNSKVPSQGSDKSVAVKEKRRIIVPSVTPPEKVEDPLPNHDEKRITEESRRFVRKASSMFDELAIQRGATKEVFIMASQKYLSKESLYRRGAVEFVYAGLHEMDRFGVQRDLQCYKALLQAFPEGKMIPRNVWQVEFMHYPRHQQCGIDMMEKMEYNGVIPDKEFGRLLQNRFGTDAHVTRKYRRMTYWLPKFKNMSPYPVPDQLPEDPIHLALLALKRMNVDAQTEYTVWQTSELPEEMEEVSEDTFIVSAQSRTQRKLLAEHDSESPLFVEGPYHVYMRLAHQTYFLLRAEPNINGLMKQKQIQKDEEDDDKIFEWKNFFEEEHYTELYPVLSVHEQDDSTILGLCITGTSSKTSAVNWVRFLQRDNPNLGHTPILFQIRSDVENQIQAIGDNNRHLKDGGVMKS